RGTEAARPTQRVDHGHLVALFFEHAASARALAGAACSPRRGSAKQFPPVGSQLPQSIQGKSSGLHAQHHIKPSQFLASDGALQAFIQLTLVWQNRSTVWEVPLWPAAGKGQR